MNIQTSIIKQDELIAGERKNMLILYQHYYDNVKPAIFYEDLKEKDYVVVIKDESGDITGFSTIQLLNLIAAGRDRLFLFSGDTIIREQTRKSNSLAGAFIIFMYALIRRYPHTPLHWFLITKGYRTYRFLQLYFREYYPVFDRPFPQYYREVLDAVAIHKFGYDYDPQTNIIRCTKGMDRLKTSFAEVPEGRLKDPHIRFFLEKNPFYYKGDELGCITDIRIDNFTSVVERMKMHAKVIFNPGIL